MQSFFRAIVAFFPSIWLFLAGLFAPPAAKHVDPPVIAPPENPQVICMDDFSLVW